MEIGLFVDQHLTKGQPLPAFTGEVSLTPKGDGVLAAVGVLGTRLQKAEVHWTTDTTEPWQKRKWQTKAAEVADVSASEVPNGTEVVEIENTVVGIEPRDHLLGAIPCQEANARNHGERSMTLTLVAMVKRENMIDLKFGEALDDPQPFVLTVTPGYVAHETGKTLPISSSICAPLS